MEPASTIEELVKRLQARNMRERTEAYFANRLQPEIAVLASVDRSTIRAYHGTINYGPLSIFRAWACAEFSFDWQNRLERAATGPEEYLLFHKELAARLQQFWFENDEGTPDFVRVRKLVDLLMKHVLLLHDLADETRTGLRRYLYVPLDKYTLKHISGISFREIRLKLPPGKWTMGTPTEGNYYIIQGLIRRIAETSGTAPIDFDLYAWNAEHKIFTEPFLKAKRPYDHFGIKTLLLQPRAKRSKESCAMKDQKIKKPGISADVPPAPKNAINNIPAELGNDGVTA